MAKITDYTFSSCDDRHTVIHARKWEPDDGNVSAVLQLIHGMQEYIERYDEFARFLADRGFAVFGHDHIGHGDSVERPEERGIMHCRYPDDTMVDDIFSNHKIIKEQYPSVPFFVLGHSMGSYLLRKYLAQKSSHLKDLSGAVIMGTGTENDVAIFAGKTICRILMAVKGRDSLSPFIQGLMFGSAYKQFDTTGMHPENSWLSKNVENVIEFISPDNPKGGGAFSLNGYMVLLRSTWYDNRMKNIRKINKDTPILLTSGSLDPVGQMGEGVRKACDKFRAAGIKDVSIKLYEGDRHEILNELDRNTVYEDLYAWMTSKMRIDKAGK